MASRRTAEVKYQVRLTAKAELDAARVLEWYRDQAAPAAGAKWFSQLMAALDKLETLPERCGKAIEAEEVGLEIRELRFGKRRNSYRIVFEIRGRTVFILRLWHSARDALTFDDL
jgi:plasmid stabilization system protein ParE